MAQTPSAAPPEYQVRMLALVSLLTACTAAEGIPSPSATSAPSPPVVALPDVREATPPTPSTAPDSSTPTAILSVALDQWRGCAVRDDHTVACWGTPAEKNTYTDETLAPDFTAPRVVAGLRDVDAIALGSRHACALLLDSTVKCWGDNAMGELGDGTLNDSAIGSLVKGLTGVIEIVAGNKHSCALKNDGTVWCWGSNTQAQLALASPGTTSGASGPMDWGVVDLDGPGFHQPPAFSGPNASLTPVQIPGIAGASSLAAHGTRTCAVASGEVRCWGATSGGAQAKDAIPTRMPAFSGVISLALGDDHSCAILADGTAKCWGSGRFGQRGDAVGEHYEQYLEAPTPESGPGLTRLASIAVGGYHTCAFAGTEAGKNGLWCWGDDRAGELGDGGTSTQRQPVRVEFGVGGAVNASVAAEAQTTCAVAGGRLACWGGDSMGQIALGRPAVVSTPGVVEGLKNVKDVVAGTGFACARSAPGSVECWGANEAGQLGDGTTDAKSHPVAVSGLKAAKAVSAAGDGACAIVGAGDVWCWGSAAPRPKDIDQDAPNATRPTLVTGVKGATELALGRETACAKTGAAWLCWGDNPTLGIERDNPPAKPRYFADGETTWAGLNPDSYRSCGWTTSGVLSCVSTFGAAPDPVAGLPVSRASGGATPCVVTARAGVNGNSIRCASQLGKPLGADDFIPVPGQASGTVVELAVGNGFGCARGVQGAGKTNTLFCFGDNVFGQLGRGTRTLKDEPAGSVLGVPEAQSVAVGDDFGCAALVDGTVRCWGVNGGQLGFGAPRATNVPVDITEVVLNARPPTDALSPTNAVEAQDPFCPTIGPSFGYKLARASTCAAIDKTLGLYWAVLEGPDVPRGSVAVPVVVADGRVISRPTGVATEGDRLTAFGSHMRRMNAYSAETLTLNKAQSLLTAFGAFPPGFDQNSGGLRASPDGTPSTGLKRDPFTLTLLTSHSPSNLGGGPSRGYAPPSWTQAVLAGDKDYNFKWTVTELGPR